MAVNKVVYGKDTLVDLTADTVTASALASGVTAHSASGGIITGTATPVGLPVPVAQGGTGATTAAGARSALGAAPLASPSLTGTPTAPTAAAGDTSTQLATTEFVADAIAAQVGDVVFRWSSDWNGISAIGSTPREEAFAEVTTPWPRGLYLVCSACRLKYKEGGAEEELRLLMATKSGTETYVQAGAFTSPTMGIASLTWSGAFWLDSDFTGSVTLQSIDWGSSPEIDLSHEWGFRDLSGKDVCRYVYVIRIV